MTTQPFFSSRKWIKVWINEWREGTLRWQATDFQRAFWIDLLALAGRSRYPGIVCAGKDGDKVVGYPAAFLAPNSEITNANIEDTLNLFKSKGMISYSTSQSVQGDALYAITITNWSKYQSDYEANKKYQRTYRERKKATSSHSPDCLTSQLVAHKTLDLEVDLDIEKEEETHTAVRVLGSEEFKTFFAAYPIQTGRKAALSEWCRQILDNGLSAVMESLERWKSCERWKNPQYIPYPAKWLADQWRSKPVGGFTDGEREQERERIRAARR